MTLNFGLSPNKITVANSSFTKSQYMTKSNQRWTAGFLQFGLILSGWDIIIMSSAYVHCKISASKLPAFFSSAAAPVPMPTRMETSYSNFLHSL